MKQSQKKEAATQCKLFVQRHICRAHINLSYILYVYRDLDMASSETILQQGTSVYLQFKVYLQ